eukprot:8865114-Karenia_brevis.AAC.1
MRGTKSFLISWTKGHALEDNTYLQENPHLRYEAVQNCVADQVARDAISTHHSVDLVDLSTLLVSRTDAYIEFVTQIHLIVSRVYIASQSLKASPAFALSHPELQAPKQVVFSPPPYSSSLMPMALSYKAHADMIHEYLQNAPLTIRGLHVLLSSHLISSAGKEPGLTWLELYLLAIALVEDPVAQTHGTTAVPAKTISAQIRSFTTHALHFVHFALPPHFHQLFRSGSKSLSRTLCFGFASHLAHTQLFVDLPARCLDALQLVVLQLTSTFTRDQSAAYSTGNLSMLTH